MICRHCGAEIDNLTYKRVVDEEGSFDSCGDYSRDEEDVRQNDFFCPECDSFITSDSDEAYDLLNTTHECPECGTEVASEGELCADCRSNTKEKDSERPF